MSRISVKLIWKKAWDNPLETAEKISAVSQILSTIEQLSKKERKKGGINDWTYVQHLHEKPGKFSQFMSKEPAVKIMLFARLSANICLLFARSNNIRMVAAGTTAMSHIIGGKYTLNGGDGAEQLGAITHTAAFLGRINNKQNKDLAVAFIGCQTILSYFVSGYTKTFGKEWTNGTALERVMRTFTYGDEAFYNYLRRHPHIARQLTYATVAFETAFPILILSKPTRIAALSIMAAFHLANARYMGLGKFFLAFIGTYPSIVWVARKT